MQKIPKKLGQILVESQIVTEQQLLSALSVQKEKKKPLGEIPLLKSTPPYIHSSMALCPS